MTRTEPGIRRGAHRTHRDATSALLPSVLAILAVTSLITALYVWRGEDGEPARARAATADAPSEPASATPSATPATPTTQTAMAGDATGGPPSSGDATTKAPVVAAVVLNQTRRGGLASVAADRLRARGWTVAGVGNFRGAVPATTVYYPAGAQAQAQKAASSLPTPARIRPRFGNLSATRLTIVVTDNYPS
jgi:hypothetical protein